MSIKPDWWIRKQAQDHAMIVPFEEKLQREGVISFGLGSFGYDLRIADEFKIFSAATGELTVVDPKAIDNRAMVDHKGDVCIIPPNSFVLGRSVEYFIIPDNVMCIVLGKSTYARTGLVANFTPLEPGWRGHITIEISNTTPLPAKVYANEGIAQVLFFEGDMPEVTYATGNRKYQGQTGITLSKI